MSADFIGEANIITCTVTAVDGATATIDIAGFQHRLPARNLHPSPAQLAVRPTPLVSNASEGIGVAVEKTSYVGSKMEYTLRADFESLFAVIENVDTLLTVDTIVTFEFDTIGPVLLPTD